MHFIAALIAHKNKHQAHGFTLIELLVLITIMSIVLGVGFVKMPSIALYKAESFSSILLTDLNLTKSLSMSQNQQYRLVIGASSYQIQDETGAAFTHPETGSSSLAYPAGVTITPAMTIMFDSLGKPYNGSTALSSTQTINITVDGTSETIQITPETGFIQ